MKKTHWRVLDVILDNPNSTLRELAAILGWSSIGSFHKYLPGLRDAGFITWKRYKSRTLRGYGRITGRVTGYVFVKNGELYWMKG